MVKVVEYLYKHCSVETGNNEKRDTRTPLEHTL